METGLATLKCKLVVSIKTYVLIDTHYYHLFCSLSIDFVFLHEDNISRKIPK